MENLRNDFEFDQIRATAEAARITAERNNRGMKSLEVAVKRHGRMGMWSVVVVVFLFAATGASGWLLNRQLKTQGTSLGELLGLQQTIDKLNRRMASTEVTVSTFPSQLANMSGRLDALDKKGGTRQVASAAKPAVPAAPVAATVTPETDNQVSQLNDRIATLQAQHTADSMKIDSLHNELALMRQDTTNEFANVRSQIPADTTPDVANLRAAVDRDQVSIATLADKMDRNRSDFEVSQGQAREVAPGILMTIKATDVGRQEVSGWLYLQNEHRFVYMKDQGLMRPITIYGSSDKQKHDIVITRVRKSYAIGYVLSPKSPVETASATGGN